jgi:putative nucleotidyltransferase with HDIG domain
MDNIMNKIFEIFKDAGHDIFLVGGFVRDRVLGIDSNDLDLATSAKPKETIAILEKAGLPSIPIGIEFGTIQTIIDDKKVEITTFRCKESYTKGSRHPVVKFGATIDEDLARRDFTFNAMAIGSDGCIIDPFGGREDLENRIIRTPGDPVEAFTDDPLRMLRAFRFLSKGIVNEICQETFDAIIQCAPLTKNLSGERVFEEVGKLLMSLEPVVGLSCMLKSGVLAHLFPELSELAQDNRPQGKWHHLLVWDHTLQVIDHAASIPEVKWAALFHDVGKPICRSVSPSGNVHFLKHDQIGADIWRNVAKRLKTSKEFQEHVAQLILEHQNGRRSMSVKAVRRLKHRLGDRLNNLFELGRADIMGHNPKFLADSLNEQNSVIAMAAKIGEVNDKLPSGTGTKISEALGIKPGPELGVVIKRLQKRLVEGTLTVESDFVKEASLMIKK